MKLTIKAESLKEPLGAIQEVVHEVNLDATDEGLRIIAKNLAKCVGVIYKVSKKLFTEYIPSEEQIGVRLVTIIRNKKRYPGLYDLIRNAKPGSFITIEEDKGKLTILVNKRKYGMGVITDIEKRENIPDFIFKAELNLNAAELNEIVNDNFLDAEASLMFSFKGNTLNIKYDAGIDTMDDTLKPTEVIKGEETSSKYSISYLRQLISTKLAKKIRFSFGDDYPLVLDYMDPEYELRFILAPRVEQE